MRPFKINFKYIAALLCAAVLFAPSFGQAKPSVTESDPSQTTDQSARKTVKPPFLPARADEDYGYLSDESRRTNEFDRLKYIPLSKSKKDWYLSIGGEIRPYYEYYENTNFGSGRQDENGYFLQRYMLHADFRFGQRIRFFAQLKSGLVNDKSSPLIPPDRNKADVNALFVDFNFGIRKPAKDKATFGQPNSFGYLPPSLILRIGRQELNFGSGRMVSFRNGPNVRQTHDGISLIWRVGKWRVDALTTKPVEDDAGYFDDEPRRDVTFWGVHASRPFSILSKSGKADFYYFGIDRKRARFEQGTEREIRHSFGARFWNAGRKFDYDLEFTGQLGKFGTGEIKAWAISPGIGYTFINSRFRPRIALDAGIVSGDKNPQDKTLNTFAPPFPRGQYFGLSAANGALNVQGVRPSIRFDFGRGIFAGISNYYFWRQSRRDGLYGVAGNLLRSGSQSRARFIGQSLETEFAWQINRNSNIQAGASIFYAGEFLRETSPAKTIKVFLLRYTFLF